ncbi:Glycosyl hydrolases family 43 [Pedobacter steynii]|uniref:Glycosyl hydrolases family 43 n=1 Tax=Pedobacter steynii TaxID=430522 RepID=A0A1G9V3Z7_9SPHI|nr:family 43 glycosylhydrolase [Pedobacter steynii]NQX40970.1 family 43 glycosylhydrolase [Pedobacter steynii]SDM66797.1 Glycosyl hydrolases family 43 [Pedobacter steynii]
MNIKFNRNCHKLLLSCLVLVLTSWSALAQKQKNTAYLFTYFTGNSGVEESIRFAISSDGYTYRALNNDQPVISSAVISSTGGVRDPHILRGADGKTFYMVVTDMVSAKGWDSNRAMVLLKSTDLINWTSSIVNIQKRFPGQENLLRVWAPQTIYDQKAGKYMVYWSMKHGADPDKIYWAYANKDFTDLETAPKQLFFSPTNGACIDGDIIFDQGKYHLFFKTEGEGLGIRVAVSDQLKEGYVLREGNVQQTKDPVEGAGVFKLNNGEGYILMYDVYTKGRYQFTKTKDLKQFTVVDHDVKMDFHPRHGTVLPITTQEANALLKKWYRPENLLNSFQSAAIKRNNVVVDTTNSTLYLPVKHGNLLKSFDPGFVIFPGMDISPKAPYDFTKGPVKLKVSSPGGKPKVYEVSASIDLNPVLNGYYADPEILYSHKTGKYHLYPTSDGFTDWAGNYFKTFSSSNLAGWKDEGVILDLPRDVSWAKRNAWAPTIAEKKINGSYKYYYYFTAAQKIGVAVADDPSGPFKDSGKALIAGKPQGIKGGQEIDPDVFTDPKSGKSYLYWGNGYMAVALLNDDMISIDSSSVKVITPDETYREGTEVFYRKGKYYFLWSQNDTRDADYGVRYGISDTPTGKINLPENNLILSKDVKQGIYATGHNSVIQVPGKDDWYIVYHRFTRPHGLGMGQSAGYHREVCIDKLEFDTNGNIKVVQLTLKGIYLAD